MADIARKIITVTAMPILSELKTVLRIVIPPFSNDRRFFKSMSRFILFQPTQNSVRVREHIYNQEGSMNKFVFLKRSSQGFTTICVIVLAFGIVGARWLASAQAVPEKTPAKDNASLLEAFRHVEGASVSDALEQIAGQRMYIAHRMQPIFPSKFAGFAVTVLLKKAEANNDPAALNGMLAAIDQGQADSVYV